MNHPSSSTDFLLLFRGADWDHNMSPGEVQEAMDKIMSWFDSVQAKSKGGHPLLEGGMTVSGKGGRSVLDGPFVESKEAVGGYMIIEAESYEEVLSLARTNPALEHGLIIEIRQIAPECPIFERMRGQTMATVA